MKINWGIGLVIGMGVFISFIMYFVITMMSDTKFDHDLVVEDYYKAELHYQQDIDAEKNALAADEQVEIQKDKNGIKVLLPSGIINKNAEGKISFYRPSNKKLDFDIPFENLSKSEFFIPDNKLVGGRWNLMVRWEIEGKEFLFKKNLIY